MVVPDLNYAPPAEEGYEMNEDAGAGVQMDEDAGVGIEMDEDAGVQMDEHAGTVIVAFRKFSVNHGRKKPVKFSVN